MAIRSLGSTLLAKAGSGSALRSAEEAKKQGAVQQSADSAQVGSVQRKTLEQPLEKAVPEGTEKIVATAPIVEGKVSLDVPGSTQTQTPAATPGGLLPQMGGAAAAARSNTPISRMAESGKPVGTPVGFQAPKADVAPTPVSGGTNLRTTLSKTFGDFLSPNQVTEYAKQGSAPAQDNRMSVQNDKPSSVNPLFGWLTGTGSRVSADSGKGGNEWNRNLLQGIASSLSGAIDNAGKFVQQQTGWTPGEANISENLAQRANTPSNLGIFANLDAMANNRPVPAVNSPYVQQVAKTVQKATSAAKNTAGNVSKAVSNTASNLRSQAQNTVQKAATAVKSAVNNAGNWLRSLWK